MECAIEGREKQWVLTQTAFDALLQSLDHDRDRAGERYVRLREKLHKFFEWRGSYAPEELADETLNRVARRIIDGEKISNVPGYALGVARRVFLETSRTPESRSVPVETADLAAWEDSVLVEQRASYVEHGLASLSPADRQLILDYYSIDSRGRSRCRKGLARKLGISVNALRLRAHRIRSELERSLSPHFTDE